MRAEALAVVFDGPLTATAPSPSLLLVGAAMLGAVAGLRCFVALGSNEDSHPLPSGVDGGCGGGGTEAEGRGS